MSNLPQSNNQDARSQIKNSPKTQSSWLRRIYDLPINRKTNLIPWFSFGGLLLVVGVGGGN